MPSDWVPALNGEPATLCQRAAGRVDGIGGNVVGAVVGHVHELSIGINRHIPYGLSTRAEWRPRHLSQRNRLDALMV